MKKTIGLLLACLLAGVFSTQAQQGNRDSPRRTVEERVKATLDKITPALSLNKGQVTQTDSAYAVYYRAVDKMRESMRQGGGGRPDMSAFQKLNKERDEKLKKIFTEDQYKKFKDEVEPSMRPQRRNNGQQGMQQGDSGNKVRKGKAAFKKVEEK